MIQLEERCCVCRFWKELTTQQCANELPGRLALLLTVSSNPVQMASSRAGYCHIMSLCHEPRLSGRAVNGGMAAIAAASASSVGTNRGGRRRVVVRSAGDCVAAHRSESSAPTPPPAKIPKSGTQPAGV